MHRRRLRAVQRSRRLSSEPYSSLLAVARSSASAPPCSLLYTAAAAAKTELPSHSSTVDAATIPAATSAAVAAAAAAAVSVPVRLSRVARPVRAEDPNKRVLWSYGSTAALFVQMGAYWGRPRTFAIVGLASKPTQVLQTLRVHAVHHGAESHVQQALRSGSEQELFKHFLYPSHQPSTTYHNILGQVRRSMDKPCTQGDQKNDITSRSQSDDVRM